MKNREKLLNMAMYDLLRKIEDYVNDKVVDSYSIGFFCAQQVFDSRYLTKNELGNTMAECKVTRENGTPTDHVCADCLQKWLNEEVET